MSRRSERVAEQIKSELATIIQREVKDPRVGLATVSDVLLSRDLGHARIRISVLGDDRTAREEAIEVLRRAKGFIRSRLARRLRLRAVPELVFDLDRGAEHSQRMSDLLESLHDEREQHS